MSAGDTAFVAVSLPELTGSGFELSVGELTGALGDTITVLPLVVALGALTPVSLPHVLALFGLFQVVWGVHYGVPLSVEPMKALAGLAVAGTLGHGEFVAAGLLAGGVLLVVGVTGTLGRVERAVGRPVVRGVQLAVALLLGEAALGLALADVPVAAAGAGLALLLAAVGARRSAPLVVLALGTVWTAVTGTLPTPSVPAVTPFPAGGPSLSLAVLEGTAAQLAMTVGNAAVATSLLLSDLFEADVSTDSLSTSMGLMSLLAVPLGGLPMCHGSGGLAGKYTYGARSGTANVVLGGLYLAAATVAGLWLAFPIALLGALLAVVAVQLGRLALDTDHTALVVAVGLLALATNVGAAFLAGICYWLVRDRLPDLPA